MIQLADNGPKRGSNDRYCGCFETKTMWKGGQAIMSFNCRVVQINFRIQDLIFCSCHFTGHFVNSQFDCDSKLNVGMGEL